MSVHRYDKAQQGMLEQSKIGGSPSLQFQMHAMTYALDFANMMMENVETRTVSTVRRLDSANDLERNLHKASSTQEPDAAAEPEPEAAAPGRTWSADDPPAAPPPAAEPAPPPAWSPDMPPPGPPPPAPAPAPRPLPPGTVTLDTVPDCTYPTISCTRVCWLVRFLGRLCLYDQEVSALAAGQIQPALRATPPTSLRPAGSPPCQKTPPPRTMPVVTPRRRSWRLPLAARSRYRRPQAVRGHAFAIL